MAGSSPILVHDPAHHKLGCTPSPPDHRTLDLVNYLDLQALPPSPPQRTWLPAGVAWGAMLNDRESDCVVAAKGHAIQVWTAATFSSFTTVTDAEIEAAYRFLSPADTGCDMLTVQNYFRRVGIGGHRSWAFARVPPNRPRLVQAAINLFGAYDLGLYLPLSAQSQGTWDVPPAGTQGPGAINSWGGHCVGVFAYDPGHLYCVTWGVVKAMTWDFLRVYGADGYAMLSLDWIRPDKHAPNGFNLAALKADISALGRA